MTSSASPWSAIGPICAVPATSSSEPAVSAGGGAYLIGSLADLPVHARHRRAGLHRARKRPVAGLARGRAQTCSPPPPSPAGGRIISPAELHVAALYQRSGEELLHASVTSLPKPACNRRSISILADAPHADPAGPTSNAALADAHLEPRSRAPCPLASLSCPQLTLYLAEQFRYQAAYPAEMPPPPAPPARSSPSLALHVARRLEQQPACPSRFGVPHPALARQQRRRRSSTSAAVSLIERRPPTGILGESLESSNLYWARLADELRATPRPCFTSSSPNSPAS